MNSIEKQILTKVVAALIAEGYHLTVDYERGYDSEPENRNLTDIDKIIEAADAVDECWLMVDRTPSEGGPHDHFVYFIWGNGNEGRDCLTDYSMRLDDTIAPISKWAEDADLQLT